MNTLNHTIYNTFITTITLIFNALAYKPFMGYNQNCQFQNCTWKCCNYYGDCPEWYNNNNVQYNSCYHYYKVDRSILIATAAGTAIGVVIITILACIWYRIYKKKQQELLKQSNQFDISNATLQTKPDVMIAAKPSKPTVVFGAAEEQNDKPYKSSVQPYGHPLNTTQFTRGSNQIYGIGPQYQKQL